ncbi:hypothetical protein [Pilimelia columellifera]|uniref:Carboxypeptidase regulatory-like domain-containing protein n=1 Tax=Pilimelia columellifera subsp. columellifera TaxID=706583 RepID=A0ABN3N834_9ACTN
MMDRSVRATEQRAAVAGGGALTKLMRGAAAVTAGVVIACASAVPVAASGPGQGWIEGRWVTAAGAPDGGERIVADRDGERWWTRADADGRFRLEVPAGVYHVRRAGRPPAPDTWAPGVSRQSLGATYRVEAGGTARADGALPGRGAVEVVVTDADTGSPVDGCVVPEWGPSRYYRQCVHVGGVYVISSVVGGGPRTMSFTPAASGYPAASVDVVPLPGATVRGQLMLRRS